MEVRKWMKPFNNNFSKLTLHLDQGGYRKFSGTRNTFKCTVTINGKESLGRAGHRRQGHINMGFFMNRQ